MRIVTFGEGQGDYRLERDRVACTTASLAALGATASFVTSPDHPDIPALRAQGVEVITVAGGAYDWDTIFYRTKWFHLHSATPALSETAAQAALAATREASENEAYISLDLRFSHELWGWRAGTPPRDLAEEVLRELLIYVDVVITRPEDATALLGIPAAAVIPPGRVDLEACCEMAAEIVEQFPNIEKVAIPLCQPLSPDEAGLGGMLYDAESMLAYPAPVNDANDYTPHILRNPVNLPGSECAFVGGLVYALTAEEPHDAPAVIRAAVASGHHYAITGQYATRAVLGAPSTL